jgi:hypothetical protein
LKIKRNLRCDKHPDQDVYDRLVLSDASSELLLVVLFGLLSELSLVLRIKNLHVLLIAAAHLAFRCLLMVGNWHLDVGTTCVMMDENPMSVSLLMRLSMIVMMRLHRAKNRDTSLLPIDVEVKLTGKPKVSS